MPDLNALCDMLLDLSRRAGADQVAASAAMTQGLEASARDGVIEEIGRSETLDIGVRVIVGNRQASVSASSRSETALAEMAERAVAMAREAPEDPYCDLPDASAMATDLPELDLCDPAEGDAERLRADALLIDEVARGVPGVAKSESSSASWRRSDVAMRLSNGFSGGRSGSFWSASCSAIAGEGLGMERDYAYGMARWRGDLRALEEIGREAGERAARRVSPRKAKTASVPIIMDQRLASSMIGHFLGAINGSSVARGSSYLAGRMGERLFPDSFTITDDPLQVRGIGSRPFDGEGLAPMSNVLVEDGVLKSWLLDSSTARQLGLASTASASFAIGSPPRPGPSNVTLTPGTRTPQEMIADIQDGFFVTEMLGASINPTTGDYSRGASGFWIENGELAYPVTEATVVGNLIDMFATLEAANDLPTDRSLKVPTLRIDVLNPAREEFFFAARGQGATLNDAPLIVDRCPIFAEANILSTKGVLSSSRWVGSAPGGRHGYVNSIAYRVCKVTTERWDVTVVTGTFSEWDLAAAQIVMEEAGGRVTGRSGAPIRYNAATPKIAGLIAAGDPLHGEVVARLLLPDPAGQ